MLKHADISNIEKHLLAELSHWEIGKFMFWSHIKKVRRWGFILHIQQTVTESELRIVYVVILNFQSQCSAPRNDLCLYDP